MKSERTRFEERVLPHLDAAYNLARWLTGDNAGADDVVQDASVRAFRFFDRLEGPSVKAWFMAIVRNAAYDWLRERRGLLEQPCDEDLAWPGDSPDAAAARASEARWVRACIASLPPEFREVVVLRELEELSYKEISAVVEVPIGTVMSRLARGRSLLQQRLAESAERRKA